MPLPVIADTFRIAIPWVDAGSSGINPINVFHVRTTSTDLADIAGAIGAAFTGSDHNQFQCLYGTYAATAINITPLDGSTAGQDENLGTSIDGDGGGGIIPACAGLVSFHTTQRGARGRGRMYVGPIGEDQQGDGVLVSSSRVNMADAWSDFIAALVTGTPSMHLVVASYVHADAHDVTSVRVDRLLATQRRRQDALR